MDGVICIEVIGSGVICRRVGPQPECKIAAPNQKGVEPLHWHKSGTIIEVKDNDQYVARMGGSRHVTLRNSKYLRKIKPMFGRVVTYEESKGEENDQNHGRCSTREGIDTKQEHRTWKGKRDIWCSSINSITII